MSAVIKISLALIVSICVCQEGGDKMSQKIQKKSSWLEDAAEPIDRPVRAPAFLSPTQPYTQQTRAKGNI